MPPLLQSYPTFRRIGLLLILIGSSVTVVLNVHRVRAQGTAQVAINNFAFMPSSVTVSPGTTVTWSNQQAGVTHTVTSDASSPVQWDSGGIASGGSFSFTFTQPGTYSYFCDIHPSMRGSITVSGTTPPTATAIPPTATNTPVPPTATAVATATATAVATATMTPIATSTSVSSTPTSTPTVKPTDPTAPATSSPTPTPTNTPNPSTPTAVTTPAPTTKRTILIRGKNNVYLFSPKRTTIKMGTRMVWKNASNAVHTVTSTNSNWKFDKQIAPGKSASFRFTRPGTYHYICSYHPGMKALIVVKR